MKKYLQIIIAAILFGTIGVFITWIGDSIHPMTLNFYRVFFGFLTLLLLCPILDKNTFKQTKGDMKEYALIGFVMAIAISLCNYAFLHAPVQNVVLIIAMFPVFVLLFASLILKEKITSAKIISLLIAFVGLLIINPLQAEGFLGNMLAIAAALTFGLVITLMRKEEQSHSIGDVVWFLFFASLFLLPFPFIFSFGNLTPLIIIFGITATGLPYLLNNLALQELEAETSSIISTIVQALVGLTGALLILGEAFNLQILIGGVFLVMAGVYLETHQKELKKAEQEEEASID